MATIMPQISVIGALPEIFDSRRMEILPDRRNDRANLVKSERGKEDEDDNGAHDLKITKLESDEGFFEGRLGHNPLFSRRIEDGY
jgi:hypothetical protein